MQPTELNDLFPNLTPITAAPSLVSMHGIGLTLYGRRDRHAETGSYVATRCFCALYIPVICLDAYRVVPGNPGTWYFLGREPTSGLAKVWNVFVSVMLIGAIWAGLLAHHRSSPEYLNGQLLNQGLAAVERGDHAVGITQLNQVVQSGTSHRARAHAQLQQLTADLPRLSPEQRLPVIAALIAADWNLQQVLTAAESTLETWPPDLSDTALAVHDLVASEGRPDVKRERQLLEAVVDQNPAATDAVSRLALLCHADGDLVRCRTLLESVAGQLSGQEGARILGGMYAEEGRHDEAYPLLNTYCAQRLKHLQACEQRYTHTEEAARKRLIAELEAGAATRDWYDQFNAANETEQGQMFWAWMTPRLESDATVKQVAADLQAAATVIPVVLELGLVTLNRAQGMEPGSQREQTLAEAEQTFLSVRGLAGDTDEFHLYFGQVCYWLNRQAEGRAEFDALLAQHERGTMALLMVANALRDIGAIQESRTLAEEAYAKAPDDPLRFAAAGLRATTPKDGDDELLWLERCDPSRIDLHVSRESALGTRAMTKGELAQAEQHYRAALRGYQDLPRTSSSLNNSSLVAWSLYQVTGDIADFTDCLGRINEAVALDQRDTILIFHRAIRLLTSAHLEFYGQHLPLERLRLPFDSAMPLALVRNQNQYRQQQSALVANETWRRFLTEFTRLQTLMPRNPHIYKALFRAAENMDDEALQRKIAESILAADLDQDASKTDVEEDISGRHNERNVAAAGKMIARLQAAAARVADHPEAQAMVQLFTITMRLQQVDLGVDLDLAELESEVRAVIARSDSILARNHLSTITVQRIVAKQKKNTPYQQAFAPTGQSLSLAYRLAWAVEQGLIRLEQQDLDALIDDIQWSLREYPEGVPLWSWVIMDTLDHPIAAEIKRVRGTRWSRDVIYLAFERLENWHPDPVLDRAWALRASGQTSAAQDVLLAARKRGVVLPGDP